MMVADGLNHCMVILSTLEQTARQNKQQHEAILGVNSSWQALTSFQPV